ncbi:MAG: hypothetical protein GX775_05850 [Erysipelothrix sp.]|nr:hypothetical protein [Erysipelothrix sp.]
MKLLSAYQKHIPLTTYQEHHYHALTLSHPFLSVRSIDPLTIEEIESLLTPEIDFFLRVNRFFFEPELQELKELLVEVVQLPLKGIIISDIGVLMVLKELGYQGEIILEMDTTLTSVNDINVYLANGISSVILARELSLDEMVEIGKQVIAPVSINFFGHQLMSTSRRKLLQAYGEESHLAFTQDKLYAMKEKTRPDSLYFIMEDEYGTHVYHGEMLNGFDSIESLSGFEYLVVDPIQMPDSMLFEVGDKFGYGTISNEELTQKYPSIRFSRGLWDTKTLDKKEEA